ncbi:MAG: 3-isopropylmalate dehydratase small subunit [Peptococcaceae bacterium]|nr:3-isopropylmalate dehydratase small subunit [Peptococcaceae bacterium]
MIYSGRLWKFGDNISTDHILPSRFMTEVEPHELAANCMAGCDPKFAAQVRFGDIFAAGENLGYGSSREQAPQALKYAGIRVVIAKSFARIFYRNCFNIGIPALICPQLVEETSEGDRVEVDLEKGVITNHALGRNYEFTKPPEFMLEYIQLGGLIPYLENQMGK